MSTMSTPLPMGGPMGSFVAGAYRRPVLAMSGAEDGEESEPRSGREGRGERRGRRGRHGRRGAGGPPWGGPAFGGPWGGPPFGGRGPRARRGDVRAAVLALLREEPMHGYQLIQEIAQRTDGLWRPSAGSVYPALSLLADEGLVRSEESDGRRVFRLTEAGEAYVAAHAEDLRAPWDAVTGDVPESAAATFALVRQVALALQQVVETGTEAQVRQAREVLAETRRALYRILAEDSPTP